MPRRLFALRVNGNDHPLEADPDERLLDVLRDRLDLTGSKYGCGEGRCGACTVLVDGEPAHSCLVRLSAVEGKAITTIEGLERDGELHPLQQAFLDLGAMQCGYCTPGMIVAGAALLEKSPDPTDAQIVEAMQGQVCRCGTYPRIVAAIHRASTLRREPAR